MFDRNAIEQIYNIDIQQDSTHKAMPIPPPIHNDAHPFFAPFRCMAYNNVTRMRHPKKENANILSFLNFKILNMVQI